MNPLKQVLNYTRTLKKQIYWASAYSFINKVFDLLPPVLIGVAVEIVVKKENSFLSDYGLVDPFHQLLVLSLLTLIVWGSESLFEYLANVKWRNIAQDLQHLLRVDTYSHVQNLDLSYFEDKNSGQLISVISDDVNQLERFLNEGANTIIQVATTVVFIGAVFIYSSPLVATFAFLPIPIILLGSFSYQKKLQPLYQNVRGKVGNLNEALVNNFRGIANIKSFTAELFEKEKLQKLSTDYCAANSQAIRVSSAFSPLIRMAVVAGFIATLVIGGKLTVEGDLSVGVYSILVFMTQRLLWPLTRLGTTFDLYQRSMASAERIFQLLQTPIFIKEGTEVFSEKSKGKIEFKSVSFSYNPGHKILDNISFQVQPGEMLAIVGSTGSGKSTVVKLLNRFYEANDGQILIGDQDIKSLKFSSLRSELSYVSQENFLFHGTVNENIKFGDINKTFSEVQQAAQRAEAQDFIESLPKQWDTIIGERGQKLSGGQQQRLSLARALSKNSSVLILDEATSAVDNETEAAIQRSLEKIASEKTTIVIAHRLSTIVNADQILVLDQGRIVEQGKHQELLNKKAVYSGLWRVQTGL